jgi:hypothetical protein
MTILQTVGRLAQCLPRPGRTDLLTSTVRRG